MRTAATHLETLAASWLGRLPLAQAGDLFGPDLPAPTSGAAGSVQVIKWICLGSVALAALFFWYFAAFTWLLNKPRPAWPRDAYGYVSAGFFSTLGVAGLALFWDDLVLDRITPSLDVGDNNFLRDWAVRTLVILAVLIVDAMYLFLYRSRARTA